MSRLLQILIIINFMSTTYGQSKCVGEYKSNFAPYGLMATALKINSDSTFTMTISIPQGNKNFNGKWSMNRDTVILNYEVVDLTSDPYYLDNDKIQKLTYLEKLIVEKKRLYSISDSGIIRQAEGYFNLKKHESFNHKTYYSKHEYYLKKL